MTASAPYGEIPVTATDAVDSHPRNRPPHQASHLALFLLGPSRMPPVFVLVFVVGLLHVLVILTSD